MARSFLDKDARIEHLDRKTVAVFGYGNQGRSQALNFRDSGLKVVVANQEDSCADVARGDDFEVVDFDSGADRGDVIVLLLPDEVQKTVYDEHIESHLTTPKTLCFAHGYNIRFGRIAPPLSTDVVLVAPRMIGVAVRELFLAGSGVPAFVAVERDASGTAWSTTLALAKALGATRSGAIETTFAEETELDLFSEQVVWPVILRLFSDAFDVLVGAGYDPNAALMELYASGEPSRVLSKAATVGLFRQATLHSHTSQFGTLSRMPRVPTGFVRQLALEALGEIRSGSFAKEWQADADSGFARFAKLREAAQNHPINRAEDQLRDMINQPGLRDERD